DLASAGVVVISGLAMGIDGAAHRGALNAEGCTVAVLGSGVDVIYPTRHGELAERIVATGGALVSQFPDGTPPRRQNFPRRNWIIAALSQIVVVVEAAEGSGALITADAALALGREVLSVPGSVFSELSVGCHQLIRDGAGVVQNARDVMGELQELRCVLDDPLRPPIGKGQEEILPPSSEHDGLWKHMVEGRPAEPGELAAKLKLPVGEVLTRLSRLELAGRVLRVDGGYVRTVRN
ncbi:MAG: DNA-processing protein DprA, partial [Candidatus Dormibacteraceae bacterium]